MSHHSMCHAWLRAVRATAKQAGRPTDKGAAVLGDAGLGFIVELPDGEQIEVGRQHCKYCARAEAISQLGAREDADK